MAVEATPLGVGGGVEWWSVSSVERGSASSALLGPLVLDPSWRTQLPGTFDSGDCKRKGG